MPCVWALCLTVVVGSVVGVVQGGPQAHRTQCELVQRTEFIHPRHSPAAVYSNRRAAAGPGLIDCEVRDLWAPFECPYSTDVLGGWHGTDDSTYRLAGRAIGLLVHLWLRTFIQVLLAQ